MRVGEIEHGARIADRAEQVWNWRSPAGVRRAERRAGKILTAAGVSSSDRVLELGCGTGLFTRKFAARCMRVTAIDVSVDLLARAVASEHRSSLNIDYVLGDAESLAFADASFDVVLGSSVLHHLDVKSALLEVHRVLRPGGRAVFAEPNHLNPQIALQRCVPMLRRWAGESPEETAFFRWRIGEVFRRLGFIDIVVTPFDFLHPATPRPLIPFVSAVGGFLEALPLAREIAGSVLISAARSGAAFTGPRRITESPIKIDADGELESLAVQSRQAAACGVASPDRRKNGEADRWEST